MSKIAIVGTAPSSRRLAPFADANWGIWACSPANADLPRIDTFFQLHALGSVAPETKHVDWINAQAFDLFMQDVNDLCQRARRFPKEELIKQFGCFFFTSTIAWMIAYAITKAPQEIGVYGVDMGHDTEYGEQKIGCQHFLWLARLAGIVVRVPMESDLLSPVPLYGYSEATPIGRKLQVRDEELRGELRGLQALKQQTDERITFLQGALSDLAYMRRTWTGST